MYECENTTELQEILKKKEGGGNQEATLIALSVAHMLKKKEHRFLVVSEY